jgi:hypothetical protein
LQQTHGDLPGGYFCVPYEDLEAAEKSTYYLVRTLGWMEAQLPKLIP